MENKFHRFLELCPATIDLKFGPFRIACIATASLVCINRVFLLSLYAFLFEADAKTEQTNSSEKCRWHCRCNIFPACLLCLVPVFSVIKSAYDRFAQ